MFCSLRSNNDCKKRELLQVFAMIAYRWLWCLSSFVRADYRQRILGEIFGTKNDLIFDLRLNESARYSFEINLEDIKWTPYLPKTKTIFFCHGITSNCLVLCIANHLRKKCIENKRKCFFFLPHSNCDFIDRNAFVFSFHYYCHINDFPLNANTNSIWTTTWNVEWIKWVTRAHICRQKLLEYHSFEIKYFRMRLNDKWIFSK